MAFGLFEAAVTSEQEVGLARQASQDKMNAAVYDVREKLGPFLFAARDLGEFRDRVALCKNDQSLYKIIEAHIPPITGTVRRIAGKNSVLEKEFRRLQAGGSVPGLGGGGATSEDDRPTSVLDGSPLASPSDAGIPPEYAGWDKSSQRHQADFDGEVKTKSTYKPSDDELIPEGNWESYRNKVDQNSSKVKRNFTSGSQTPPVPGQGIDTAVDTGSSAGNGLGNWEADLTGMPAPMTGQEDDSFQGRGPMKASSLQVAMYRDWCEANDYSPVRLSSLDAYATNLDDDDYLKLASAVQEWEHEHKPKTPKGQGQDRLKDVTAGEHSLENYPRDDPRFQLDESYHPRRYSDPAVMGPDNQDSYAQAVTDESGARRYPELPRHHAPAHEASYNGYADQDAFHDALAEMAPKYIKEREEGLKKNPHGYDHEGCDHAYGICNAPSRKALRDPMRSYTAWCQANNLKRISAKNVAYFAGNDSALVIHLAQRMKKAIHTARLRQAKDWTTRGFSSNPNPGYNDPDFWSNIKALEALSPQERAQYMSENTPAPPSSPPPPQAGDAPPLAWMQKHLPTTGYRPPGPVTRTSPQPVPWDENNVKKWWVDEGSQSPMGQGWADDEWGDRAEFRSAHRIAAPDPMRAGDKRAECLKKGHDWDFKSDGSGGERCKRCGTTPGGPGTLAYEYDRRGLEVPERWDAVSRDGWSPEDQGHVEKLMKDYGLTAEDAKQEFYHGGHEARRRTAAPDYLQKADDALTQLLNQKAEEFQQTIAPLQQALVTVQQAEQLQQQSNPLNVQPPAGTVNVLPQPSGQGQDPSAALGGPAGGDPMAAAAALAGMGAPGGGGGLPTDQGGPPPAAADQGALPPDPTQQLQARRRQAGDSVKMTHIPECDICKYDHGKSGVPASYDGKTKMGPWANMCEQHFRQHGVGLGTGKGQKLSWKNGDPVDWSAGYPMDPETGENLDIDPDTDDFHPDYRSDGSRKPVFHTQHPRAGRRGGHPKG